MSNMQEVAARGGRIILITDPRRARRRPPIDRRRDADPAEDAGDRHAAGLRHSGAASRLSHRCAMGTDVDQPRNLAKSVTVE
ncbi:MAG: hypothetical protein M5U33_03895 [Pseudorhodoplanes sp.]|nr:hypothetical protein [Pseudorhodoplanes sp.]